jgi:hypothetical protein
MANTYVWKVAQCDRTLADGMINTLHYTVNATDAEGTYSAGAYGSAGLKPADAESMIKYDEVTEAQAISWAQAAIGGADKVAEIHAALDAQLVEKKTPTKGAGVPWSA